MLSVKSGRRLLCIANGIFSHFALIVGVNIVLRLETNVAITMAISMLLASLFVPLAVLDYVSSNDTLQKSK